jgi:hypothetical protein
VIVAAELAAMSLVARRFRLLGQARPPTLLVVLIALRALQAVLISLEGSRARSSPVFAAPSLALVAWLFVLAQLWMALRPSNQPDADVFE